MSENILEIKNLKIQHRGQANPIVKNLSLKVSKGEIIGLVGESGAGKSVSILTILDLINSGNNFITNGEINFRTGSTSINLLNAEKKLMQKIRRDKIGMIFQEPMSALNPIISCGEQVLESIINQKIETQKNVTFFRFIQYCNKLIRFIKTISFSILKLPYLKTTFHKEAKMKHFFGLKN